MADNSLEKRYEKFLEECSKAGISFQPRELTRLKNYFTRRLPEEYGSGLAKADFASIIDSMDGCNISAIQEYINNKDMLAFANEKESEVEDNYNSQKSTAQETSPANESETESVSPIQKSTVKPESEKTYETKKKKESKVTSNVKETSALDFKSFIYSGIDDKAKKEEISKLKRRIYVLERDKKLVTRYVSMYRQDHAFFQSIEEYGSKSRLPLEIAGVKIDSMYALMHAAATLVAQELAATGNEKLVKYIQEARDRTFDTCDGIDEEIQKLKDRLEKLQDENDF